VEDDLFNACYGGTPVPGAAPYAGEVHPLVVVDMNNGWVADDVGINETFVSSGWPWASPIQLVVCARSEDRKSGSCGLYRTEAGEVGDVTRYREVMTLRVVGAATGKVLQKKVITSAMPKCPRQVVMPVGQWHVETTVTGKQVNAYAKAVSKQKVQ
jgi:hypothetical protein